MAHLSLAQALEAYHGIKFRSHRDRGLRAKISESATTHAVNLRGLVTDLDGFAAEVGKTRNHYTHHNPADLALGGVAERADLVRMNEKLKLLFQMCVLSDLGIPAGRFSCLRRQLATEIIEYT